jgi:hypothetical protein
MAGKCEDTKSVVSQSASRAIRSINVARKRAIIEQTSTRLFSERAQPFKDVPSKRELLQSEESIRVLRWGDIPSPNYTARLVAPQSTGGLE